MSDSYKAAALAAAILAFATSARALDLPHVPEGNWLRGDLHVHDDHSSDGSLPRQCCDQQGPGNNPVKAQIDFATGEGLQFLPLTDHRTYDQHYDPEWESANLLLIRGEETNGRPHALAHGAVDTIVQGANPPGAPGFAVVQQSIWEAHAQDANWVTAHPDDGETNDDGTPNANASAVGIDLIEVWNRSSPIEKEMAYAEGRWNAGFRTGISGASDDHFIEVWPVAGPGMPTTRVFASAPTERGVIDGLRAGHTSISADATAPFAKFTADVNGDGVYETMAGDDVVVAPGTRVTLKIVTELGTGTTVRVYRSPGKSAGAVPFKQYTIPTLQVLATPHYVSFVMGNTPTWFRVEVRGRGLPDHYDISSLPFSILPDPQELPDQLRAITSPIFFSPAPVEAQGEIPVPADVGTGDGAALMIGNAGAFAGFPDVAVSGSVMHVVAESHVGAVSQIVYRRRVAGLLQAPQLLSPAPQESRFPKVAARGNDVWVAWQGEPADEQPHRPAIFLRHSVDGGVTWLAQQKIRTIPGRCEHPALALTVDGKPLLAWQEIQGFEPFDVMAQIVGRDAAPINVSNGPANRKTVQPALPDDSRSARYPASVWPALAVAADGRMAVGWQDDRTDPDPLWTGQTGTGDGTDPDNWQIMVRMRNVGTGWLSPRSIGANDRADRHPTLGFGTDGALNVAWTSKPLDASGVNEALLTTRSFDGLTWSAPATVSANAAAQSLWPRLSLGADGLRLAWHDSRSADWRWRVMTARQAAGGAWGSVQLWPGRGINTWPALAGNTLVFASTRNATRLQRDRTQQIFAIDLP